FSVHVYSRLLVFILSSSSLTLQNAKEIWTSILCRVDNSYKGQGVQIRGLGVRITPLFQEDRSHKGRYSVTFFYCIRQDTLPPSPPPQSRSYATDSNRAADFALSMHAIKLKRYGSPSA
ncbi:MAG: hypothetical protein AAGU11_22930, partial [Syntrophobacteraceae bacterium]